MNKKYFVFLFVFFFAFQVRAGLKIDAAGILQSTVGSIQTTVESATKGVDVAGSLQQLQTYGDKVKVEYEKIQGYKNAITDKVQAGKEAYEKAKETVEKVESTYEDQMANLKKNQIISQRTLTHEKDAIDQKINDRKTVLQKELSARNQTTKEQLDYLSALKENMLEKNEDISQIEEQMSQAEALRATYALNLESIKNGGDDFFQSDEEYRNLLAEKKQKEQQIQEIENNLKENAQGIGVDFVKSLVKRTPEENKEAYNEALGKVYLSEDDEITGGNVLALKKQREYMKLKSVAEAYAAIINFRQSVDEADQDLDVTVNNIEAADYALSALGFQNQMLIHELKKQQAALNLKTIFLKHEANQKLQRQTAKPHNPDKDPSVLDLDSYEMTQDDVENGESNVEGVFR